MTSHRRQAQITEPGQPFIQPTGLRVLDTGREPVQGDHPTCQVCQEEEAERQAAWKQWESLGLEPGHQAIGSPLRFQSFLSKTLRLLTLAAIWGWTWTMASGCTPIEPAEDLLAARPSGIRTQTGANTQIDADVAQPAPIQPSGEWRQEDQPETGIDPTPRSSDYGAEPTPLPALDTVTDVDSAAQNETDPVVPSTPEPLDAATIKQTEIEARDVIREDSPLSPTRDVLSWPLSQIILAETGGRGSSWVARFQTPDGRLHDVERGGLVAKVGARIVSIQPGQATLAWIEIDDDGEPRIMQRTLLVAQ